MAQHAQVGTQIYTASPPRFTGFIVVGGTWSEDDTLQVDDVLNQDEQTINTTGWDPGRMARCDMVAQTTTAATSPLLVLDVLNEVTPSTRQWLVRKVTQKFAKRKVIFSIELSFKAAQDLTLVS
jgi:hypothetical protein